MCPHPYKPLTPVFPASRSQKPKEGGGGARFSLCPNKTAPSFEASENSNGYCVAGLSLERSRC